MAAAGLALLLQLTAQTAPLQPAATDLRCGTRMVTIGMTRDEVRALCGPPSAESSWYRPFGRFLQQAVLVSEWTYDRGPYQLVRVATFVEGALTGVRVGGYGTR